MSKIKSLLKSSRVRTILALVVIGIAVIVVLLGGSREADPNIGLGADPETPTVGITNPVATLAVNRDLVYQHVTITVTSVQEASAFSDDRKQNGAYTVRVQVHVQPGNEIQSPQGMNYMSLVRLILPNGEAIAPKLSSVLPLIVPQQPKDGYFDFPLTTAVDLSALTLRVGNVDAIAFSQ